jgi:hypothetical protein
MNAPETGSCGPVDPLVKRSDDPNVVQWQQDPGSVRRPSTRFGRSARQDDRKMFNLVSYHAPEDSLVRKAMLPQVVLSFEPKNRGGEAARRAGLRHAALQVDGAKNPRSKSSHRRSVAASQIVDFQQACFWTGFGGCARRDRGPGRRAGSWLFFSLPASCALGLDKPNRFDRRPF